MSVSRHGRAQGSRPGRQPPRGSAGNRLPWIDRLRLCIIAGVIVMHASTAYVVNVGWYYEERTTSTASIVAFFFPMNAALIFGLGPLYLVAGWLASRSVSRHGSLAFLRSRLLRLGLPTVLFIGVIGPVAAYLGNRAEGGHSRGAASCGPRHATATWGRCGVSPRCSSSPCSMRSIASSAPHPLWVGRR